MTDSQERANRELRQNAAEVANHQYDASDYEKSDQLSAGIAETHEQISDDYAAGTSDGVLIREEGVVEASDDGYDDEIPV